PPPPEPAAPLEPLVLPAQPPPAPRVYSGPPLEPIAPSRSVVVQASLDLFATAGEPAAADRLARLHAVRARAIHGLAVLPVVGGEDPRGERLVGLALAARDGSTAYVALAHAAGPNQPAAEARELIGPVLADASVPKVGSDLKRALHALDAAGLPLEGLAFDTHIASYLC